MRNAGLNETCCQNEVSENQAPAADSTTSKVTISRRVTEFCKQTVCRKVGNRDRLSQPDKQSISSLCREAGLIVCRYLNFARDISGLSCSSRARKQASTDRVVDRLQRAPVALRWSIQLRPRNMCPE
jgi:hypothetical protein